MSMALKVGIVGSCLSNLPTLFLISDYNFVRLNNTALPRSDIFVKNFINGTQTLPNIEEMMRFLDLPADDSNNSFRYLAENYKEYAGLTEISRDLPTFHANLLNSKFDVLLLDNLIDVDMRLYKFSKDGMDFEFGFPMHLAGANNIFNNNLQVTNFLTPEQSADNWISIIEYLKKFQPQAQIIFSATHSCTSDNMPERAARAADFYKIFQEKSKNLDIVLIPPLNLPDELTKGESDWAHFDMKVYRGIAGYIHTLLVAGWTTDAVGAPNRPSRLLGSQSALRQWNASPSLSEVIGRLLDLPAADISENSGMDVTENWDSLKQVEILTGVEAAFNVRFSFEATMETATVGEIRRLLAGHGIAASDDANYVEIIFSNFVQRAVETPDERFAKFIKNNSEKTLTYRDVASDIITLKDALTGVEPGSIVAIILDHSQYIYSSFICCTLLGLIPTMLPPLTRKQDPAVFKDGMEVLFSRITPAAVITTRDLAQHVPRGIELHCVLVDDLVVPSDAWERVQEITPALATKDALAFLQHSSGTTGHKKGVMLTHAQVLEQCRLYANSIKIETGDVICSWLPLYHDMGLITSFVIPAIVGCPIISMDAIEWVTHPTLLLDQIQEEKAAYAWLPNFAFLHIAKFVDGSRWWDLSSIKAVISCSEPCRIDAFDAFAEKLGPMGCDSSKLGTSYAMAENVFAVSQSVFGTPVRMGVGELSPYLSSGQLLPGVEVEIREKTARVPDGQIGEIWIRSSSMFSGYYALPELSAERIVEGWYNTRDLGAFVDNELFVKGRSDDVIIINGKNVVAHEIEDEINRINGLAPGRVLVASRYDSSSSTAELIVLAEPLEDCASDAIETEIRNLVFSLCSVSPRRVRLLPRGFLIKSTSGKISRSKSLEKFEMSEL
ncbi:Acyl-CoA synthetase (AMP-forming)/AMP-acid ligase II [Methylobacterium sp. 174MFSha1.1]|uniref:AMP-binding protein n=1 Tax=Methylobacterium sp. 174MFSha1.1 TaxID=1502749 RepID=UPI0008EB8B08|nr:AMP-binding protein [Methylobacterium sp. 174MFSha1.1]SFV15112.1 Acyl-CoA synthetase (AMP-forming)/AMP-acid ligase II [Methylobacterium sp. 174MFSha1.1]